MAFAAAFAPVLPRLRPAASDSERGGVGPLVLPRVTPGFGDPPEATADEERNAGQLDVVSPETEEEDCDKERSQSLFAPMLFFKRAQAESSWANHAVGPFTRLQEKAGLLDAQRSEDERLQEAAESLEIGLRAIELAEEIARNIWRDLSGEGLPVDPASSSTARHEPHVHSPLVHAGTCEQEDTSERPMPSQWLRDAYAEIHQVAASVAHAATAATQLGEASPAPAVVEGVLHVDGGSELEASVLQEILREILLQVLSEVQVKDVELVCTSLRPISIFDLAPAVLEDRNSVAFAFKVSACDPNDLEPVREMLLLEAESGGARHLLPLLVQKLYDEDLLTAHLKVRMEVGEDP